VTQAATGSVTLSWSAPTENTDGTALTNLAGYHIYYGTTAAAMTATINIGTVGLTTYVIDNLPSGNWFFAIQAYNSANVESSDSAVVTTTI
jgi:hypothetical protein